MKPRYIVRQNGDGVGYYVVALSLSGMELWIKGTSLDKQEMIALAEKLNKEQEQQ